MLVINVYICPGDSSSSFGKHLFFYFFSTSSKYEATLAFFVLCFLGDLMNIQSPFTVALYLSPQTP